MSKIKPLFIKTSMTTKQAQLIRITTSNLHDMTIDALGKRIRELDGFAVKVENVMFTGQQPQGNSAAFRLLNCTKGGSQI